MLLVLLHGIRVVLVVTLALVNISQQVQKELKN